MRIDAFDNDDEKTSYYGQIEDTWELNYSDFKVPVLRCHWVQGAKGVMKDLHGFTTVDLEKVGYKEEPFVPAGQVSQVFYVPDMRNKKQHVVLPGKRRVVGVENVMDEEEYNQFDEVPPFGSCNLPVILESETTPYLRSSQKDKGVTKAKGRKTRRKRQVKKR